MKLEIQSIGGVTMYLMAITTLAVLSATCPSSAQNFDRREADTFDEMSSIIQMCYQDKDIDCIMDFIYVKGVDPALVSALRDKLQRYVGQYSFQGTEYYPVTPVSGDPIPTRRLDARVFIEPTYLPVEARVYLYFDNPKVTDYGFYKTIAPDAWPFWHGVENGVSYLVLEERRPFEMDEEAVDAFIMIELGGWYSPDELASELEAFSPEHSQDDYAEMLNSSFLRLNQAGWVDLCVTESPETPRWGDPLSCQDRPSQQAISEIEHFWNTGPTLAGDLYYWIGLTHEGDIESRTEEYEEIYYRIHYLLDGITSNP